MTIIITITHKTQKDDFYKYNDKINIDAFTDDYIIGFSGQNQGRCDKLLIDAIKNKEEFKIYYRKNNSSNFFYLGKTILSNILQNRTKPRNEDSEPNERLMIELIVKKNKVENIDIGKNKESVFKHSGLSKLNPKPNQNLGFYKI